MSLAMSRSAAAKVPYLQHFPSHGHVLSYHGRGLTPVMARRDMAARDR